MWCDLHIHSTASDGTVPPGSLPALAKRVGLRAMALTDHDTTAGLARCAASAKKLRIPFVPGIELSADPEMGLIVGGLDSGPAPQNGKSGLDTSGKAQRRGTLHILGYFIRQTQELAAIQQRLLQARADRNPKIVAELNELGVDMDYAEVKAAAAEGGSGTDPGGRSANRAVNDSHSGHEQVVGRPHIAAVLVRKGYVKSIHEAFERYIGPSGAAYVPKERLGAAEAIRAIHTAEGLAVLAHPTQLRMARTDALEHLVSRLKDQGLDGIETRHSDHTPGDVERFERWAQRFNLLTSGGSDYHGTAKTVELGQARVPLKVYQNLRAASQRHKPPRDREHQDPFGTAEARFKPR